ncbi:hypothetical protein Tco_0682344 [Tanacetum coccineum]|uniref:Reverse transcriptase domain-containing protein n=1 Tax=Tanacetum coccineum TaxID=301880 RepID=A0ABQ4XQW5_9ASTR
MMLMMLEVHHTLEEVDPLNLPPPDFPERVRRIGQLLLLLMDHEQEDDAAYVGTQSLGYHLPLCAHSRVPSMWVLDLLDGFLLLALQQEISTLYIAKSRALWTYTRFRHYRERAICGNNTPVTPVDRTDSDDPSPRPTRRPRHDDPYVMVRDAATRDEEDDAATTSEPQPSHPPGSPHYHLIMPPRMMTQAAIEKLVSDRVAAALALIVCFKKKILLERANPGRQRRCCVMLSVGSRKKKSVFSISECAERYEGKVLAAATLQGSSLAGEISSRTLGLRCRKEERGGIYVRVGLPETFKGETTSSRPIDLNEAVRMAHTLNGAEVTSKAERNLLRANKRKWGEQTNNNTTTSTGPHEQLHAPKRADRQGEMGEVISCIKARKYIERGSQLFLAQVTEKEPSKKQLQDVPVIRNFPEVFPDDLPGLPPSRQVEFRIELVPGAAPVARAPYRLAPLNEELSDQLKENY